MAKIWINPAFKKKKPEKEVNDTANLKKVDSMISGPQKFSREFLQKLIDNKTQTKILFYDGTMISGKLIWFDNQTICFEEDGKEIIFDSKNIIYYRS